MTTTTPFPAQPSTIDIRISYKCNPSLTPHIPSLPLFAKIASKQQPQPHATTPSQQHRKKRHFPHHTTCTKKHSHHSLLSPITKRISSLQPRISLVSSSLMIRRPLATTPLLRWRLEPLLWRWETREPSGWRHPSSRKLEIRR